MSTQGDRDALKDLILWAMHAGLRTDVADVWVERFLALVRPVESVVLSPEEAEAMQAALAVSLETEPWSEPIASTLRALAARLEASS